VTRASRAEYERGLRHDVLPLVRDADRRVLLAAALGAATRAGEIIRRGFDSPLGGIERKDDGDYVTDVDIESEHAIRAWLARCAPGIPVVGEELGGSPAPAYWLVDPLDGTTNFVRRYPSVAVSIALVETGRPVLAVVHAPLWQATWCASAGEGAWRDGEPISAGRREIVDAVCVTGLPPRGRRVAVPEYVAAVGRVLATVEDVRRLSPASLDLALVAAGVFDGFFECGLSGWDTAAGALLVREAGGAVTDWEGDVDAWLASGAVVAAAPLVHRPLLDALAP
jgi:myo-inositol-1(or 4)-monophosphatase